MLRYPHHGKNALFWLTAFAFFRKYARKRNIKRSANRKIRNIFKEKAFFSMKRTGKVMCFPERAAPKKAGRMIRRSIIKTFNALSIDNQVED